MANVIPFTAARRHTPMPLPKPAGWRDRWRGISDERREELLKLIAWLDQAARSGRLVGLCLSTMEQDGSTHQCAAGNAVTDPEEAHYGVARLSELLLWRDE